ncbi:nitroreductase [Rhodobacter aestuarii]|uniref:Nitroreductase n=1 Tax=Rhodobacter aestuarii TaxID=453582 RepID=A0A1N7MA43_9RHOB|nr:nitroreductase family protein [Rhodobacter aestuarii]PTV94947.1 nitroreductase [Rhodobacter aestuarii]SIS82922.1 Nitroreductase [Rhodobacter aestuarii]
MSILKKLATRLPPAPKAFLRAGHNSLRTLRNSFYATYRFLRNSSTVRSALDRDLLSAVIYKQFHAVEKGLALPQPRPGFGAEAINNLMGHITHYETSFGPDTTSANARAALKQYVAFNHGLGVDVHALEAFLAKAPNGTPEGEGGAIKLQRGDLFPVPQDTAIEFLRSRRTLRNFTGEAIPQAVLEDIYAVASRAPSVCNRQAGGVYFATGRAQIDHALSFQNGNRGFGEKIGALAIVTADQRAFTSPGELHQDYVDGGIFAMSLLLAAHAKQLGGCMLNWSVDAGRDRSLRLALGIPEYETIITMIGFGVPTEQFSIALSPRVPAEARLHWLD